MHEDFNIFGGHILKIGARWPFSSTIKKKLEGAGWAVDTNDWCIRACCAWNS